ncbi:hypothetical protein HD553DRAFT_285015, partial [Filobasidium floriforme]|uniref:uncharacterized protein n=1 Tax=Filobasidium floriforme TaxID=5210 RepID=UPI001E8D8F08
MIEAVGEQEWKRFYSDKGRVRCFAHILNLISGAIIEGATGLKWDEEEEEKADDDEDVYPEEPFDEDGNIVPDVEDLEDDQEVL